MDFSYSPRTLELQAKLLRFMDEHIYPAEAKYEAEIAANTAAGKRWTPLNTIEELKPKARAQGLWNLFLPPTAGGEGSAHNGRDFGLSNSDYAPLAEIMGRVPWSSEVFNCSAPDPGNMETIERYGKSEHKTQWLEPLLDGKIRSAFAMTEPAVASSDATNIASRIERNGDDYVINGRKWWISGAGDPRCKIYIFMGKTDPEAPRHSQQSMILVPADTKGITVLRPLSVFGYDDAPHGHMEIDFDNVRVPASSILLGEGRGFEIAQGLWNLFLPPTAGGKDSKGSGREFGLSNGDYAPLAEIMGRVPWSSEVFNCSAPDTGNMETIERYGKPEHKTQWLEPLLDGKIRSAFAMTEPAVASSDATNIASRIERNGDD